MNAQPMHSACFPKAICSVTPKLGSENETKLHCHIYYSFSDLVVVVGEIRLKIFSQPSFKLKYNLFWMLKFKSQ